MLKTWCKLMKDGKLIGQWVANSDESLPAEQILEAALKDACYHLDLPNPIILKKHLKDIEEFHLTKFLPESFMEAVPFDRMEIVLFDEKPKNIHA